MGFGVMTAGAVVPASLNEYDIADTGAVSYAVGDETSKSYVHISLLKIPRTGGAGTSTGDYYKAAGRGGLPDAESDCLNRGLCPVQIGQGNTERDISRGRWSTAKYKTASGSGNSEPIWRA